METPSGRTGRFLSFSRVVERRKMPKTTSKLKSAAAILSILIGAAAVRAQTELEVWPTGVNGPQTWPPDLHNPWWDAQHKYPEGGDPPPVDLFDRIKCPGGSKV